jgi:hypothetical protein
MTYVSPPRLPVLVDLSAPFAKERQPVVLLAAIINHAPRMMFVFSQTMGSSPFAGGPQLPVVHALTTILAQMATLVCWVRMVIMRSVSQAQRLLVFHVTITTHTRQMISARLTIMAHSARVSLRLHRLSERKLNVFGIGMSSMHGLVFRRLCRTREMARSSSSVCYS